ncbi:MAG: AAA family ATPase [Bacteroidaceae bacterium]|nr:AAA family ATPase [Bacteroidaceae bacterium]
MESNYQTELARGYINRTNVSVFLTGKAGTGKTTFLKSIVETTPKRCVVLAPTGVAAVNAGGQTIHSFFQLPLCPYLPDCKELVTEYQLPESHRQLKKERINIIRTLDLLIIDEISMVRADLLDAVDNTLRRYRRSTLPFGGVQLLMIGDVQQLPPVVKESERPYLEQVYPSAFFFSAKVMQRLRYVTIQLTHVFRQSDAQFLDILNAIRDGNITDGMLEHLNSRVDSSFRPEKRKGGQWIRLTTHNMQADAENLRNLERLKGRIEYYDCDIEGNFPQSAYPADESLGLKVGAQVMFVRNDSRYGQYYNGKIGIVDELDDDHIMVRDQDGGLIAVERETWENTRYELDSESGEIRAVTDGKFTQFPLRLAWAVTVHKSQGLTFDHVVIDVAQAFTYGQVYVALSRCRTLDGIVLISPIRSQNLFAMGRTMSDFCNSFPDEETVQKSLGPCQTGYYFDTLFCLFDFSGMVRLYSWAYGIFAKELKALYPAQTDTMLKLYDRCNELEVVASKFRHQLQQIQAVTCGDTSSPQLKERINSAVGYFLPALQDMSAQTANMLAVDVDNKEVRKSLADASSELLLALGQTVQCMLSVQKDGFSVDEFNRIRTRALLNQADNATESGRKTTNSGKNSSGKAVSGKSLRQPAKPSASEIYGDIGHPELVQPLVAWRREKYIDLGVPAYVVLSQKALLGIADACPETKSELLAVKGFGKVKWELYGQEILDLVARNRE